MWVWLVVTLVFFSIPRSKLIGYVMVAAPPLAVLAAEGLLHVAGTPARLRTAVIRVASVALLVGAGMLTFELHRDHNQNYTRQVAAKLGPLLTSPADPVIL